MALLLHILCVCMSEYTFTINYLQITESLPNYDFLFILIIKRSTIIIFMETRNLIYNNYYIKMIVQKFTVRLYSLFYFVK